MLSHKRSQRDAVKGQKKRRTSRRIVGVDMVPLLLHILLVATLSSDCSAITHTGRRFVVAFPENIAFYHPVPPDNRIQITAIKDATITIEMRYYTDITESLSAGQFKEYSMNIDMELSKTPSFKMAMVKSSDLITVNALSLRSSSLQLALVLPVHELGTKYMIPQVPHIPGTTDIMSMAVTERRPFKLVIVSAQERTTVTIKGLETTVYQLEPEAVGQVLVTQENQGGVLMSDQPVAVLFSHSCAIRDGCSCGMLQTLLLPAKNDSFPFLVPPALANGTVGETFILSGATSNTPSPYVPETPWLDGYDAAVLYRPGFLLSLVPQTDLASCFIINSIQNMENEMVMVVHKNHTERVRHGNAALVDPNWQQLTGTDYMWAAVSAQPNRNVVWHQSSKMILYFLGHSNTSSFGVPATIISRIPDFRGCVLVPERLLLGDVAHSWAASVQFCRKEGLDLVSFSKSEEVPHIYSIIKKAMNGSEDDVWIGLRRRSQTGEWYWLNQEPVAQTNWAQGEPGEMNEGQCTIMSLSSFRWRDEECCQSARPVCYKRPEFFPV